MQNQLRVTIVFFLFIATVFFKQTVLAQQYDCNFKEPVINIDFGSSRNQKEINLLPIANYNKIADNECPNDGNFSFASYISGCFGANWHQLPEDHTPGDINGRMMVVNAAKEPGIFFINYISGLKSGTTYEISVWLVNICITGQCGTIYSPDINIAISSGENNLAQFATGIISPTQQQPQWKKYTGLFTVPAGATVVAIKMDDNANGGCGNDFAMDDIQVKECRMLLPPVTEAPQPLPAKTAVVKQVKKPAAAPVVKENNTSLVNSKKSDPVIATTPLIMPVTPTAVKIEKLAALPLPLPIATRANPLIRKIETAAAELVIELYDNGEIDGDTVTIYHNNQLLVAHAGLTARPVTLKIKVDKEHPHHELVMVADNLGSIPPNTSLMILTAGDKRYEIFISSTEQKNAKIVIDLKEP